KIFLFESKDILINATIKHSYDFTKYEKELRKKLYYEESDGKTEKKAVLQLLKNIENILKKEFPADLNYKTKSVIIYPIIVLHDHQFNVLGLNSLVNHWFKIEVKKLGETGV